MMRVRAAGILILVLSGAACAQSNAKVSDLGWMAGDWTATVGQNKADRSCSEPVGGSMTCMMRVIAAEKVVWLEFSVLRETSTGIVLDTRFFSGDAQPAPPIANELRLKSATATEWTFENPSGTQPKMETISRAGTGSMTAHAELVDSQGKTSAIDSKWQKAR